MTIYAGPKARAVVTDIREVTREVAWQGQSVGAARNQYDIVYRDQTFWRLADAFSATAIQPIGLGSIVASAASGQTTQVWVRALISNGGWLFVSGANVYLASGGGTTMSAMTVSGSWTVLLGVAVASNTLDFYPQQATRITV